MEVTEMKRSLTELFDGCGPEELDRLLPEGLDEPLSRDARERVRRRAMGRAFPQRAGRNRRLRRTAAAACLALAVGAAGLACAAEAREYGEAVRFFQENGLPTDGLSRAEVKAVYRDITTRRFACDQTAQVIKRSVAGVEISQREPEELAELWSRRNPAETGYSSRVEERMDRERGFEVFDRSFLDCRQDGEVVWTAEFSDFYAEDWAPASGGLAVWGYTPVWSSEMTTRAWVARVDGRGTVEWEAELDHGFHTEYVAAVLDNGDGTWAVISRGDLNDLCLSQYSDSGEELSFHKTEVGNRGIWNAAALGDGYLVQLGRELEGETAHLVRLDREGGVTDRFTYQGEDCYYRLTDMAEFHGQVYLSAYAVSKRAGEDTGRRYEIGEILDEIFESGNFEISSQELTPKVRDLYTAVLLVCGAEGGEPETFYSIEGSLGAELSVSEAGELVWEVERIAEAAFSPATSAYSIRGACNVFRYAFDGAGALVRQEDAGKTAEYFR